MDAAANEELQKKIAEQDAAMAEIEAERLLFEERLKQQRAEQAERSAKAKKLETTP